MLFSTSGQFSIFIYILFCSFCCGFLFDISALLTIFCNKNKIAKNIFNFVSMSLTLFIFYRLNIVINYGEIRWFCILALLLGLVVQRITIGKIIAKFYNWWYIIFEKFKTKINKSLTKIKGKNERKKESNQ